MKTETELERLEEELRDKTTERDCLNEEIASLEKRIFYLKNPGLKEKHDSWIYTD